MLISELGVIETYPERSQELAKKYLRAKEMTASGRTLRQISNELNESFGLIWEWINVGRKPGAIKVIERLKEMDLVPLEKLDPNDKKHEMLVKLHAFAHSDGTLYKGQIALYGQKEDLEEIEGELHYIFPEIKTYLRKSEPGGLVSYGTGYLLMIYSAHLAKCLISLGAPTGDKVINKYYFPKWLFNCPRELSKLWLEVFLGAEGTALNNGGHRRYYPLQIQLNKWLEHEENILNFLDAIKRLFSEFGIISTPVRRRQITIRKKDKKKIGSYYFNIIGDVFNIIRFLDTFTYRYARDKQLNNERSLQEVKIRHGQYLEQINAFLVAKKLKYFGYRYKKLKEYYHNNPRINKAVAWNTFYSYYKGSGITPRYLNKFTLHWPGKDGTVLSP